MLRIVYLGSSVGYNAILSAVGRSIEVVKVDASLDAVKKAFSDADAIVDASMKVRITDDMIRNAPSLKIISCATTGSDHIERLEIKKRGIPIKTLQEDADLLKNLTPAAEHSWALLMACARRLPAAFAHVKSGRWNREDFPGIMLHGKKIGIVGCGRIGSWMSRYANAFGMEVMGV